MIARCVVRSGTSSYYSAMKDASSEPVLKEIAAHIAADEFAHYRLFYETLAAQDDEKLTLWQRLYVAVTRVNGRRTTNSPMPITAPIRPPIRSGARPTTARRARRPIAPASAACIASAISTRRFR